MKHKKIDLTSIFIFVSIFIMCYLFFSRYHSLSILDTDDWKYINYSRALVPDVNEFNPIKVFPENFFSFVSKISYRMFYNSQLGFTRSLSTGYNIVISVIVSVYVGVFYKFISKNKNKFLGIILTFIFFVLHFVIYRCGDVLNQYGFYSITVNNYFNYLIPTLLNLILLLWVIADDNVVILSKNSILKNIIFLVLGYFAIFSNLFSNEILPIYLVLNLVFKNIRFVKKSYSFQQMVRNGIISFVICVEWAISMCFELNGARAGQLSTQEPFISRLKTTLYTYMASDINMILVAIFSISVIVVSLVIYKKEQNSLLIKINLMALLVFIYCLLLSAKVNTWYISRADVQIEFIGILLFSVVYALGYINTQMTSRNRGILLIIVLLSLLLGINSSGKTYKDSNIIALEHRDGDFGSDRVEEINDYIIDQIIEADNSNESNIIISVPCFYNVDNWPLTDYGFHRISEALYEYGVIDSPVEVVIEVDESLNYMWQ
ncbi:MAG: hypothetical protein K6B67_00910 [Lachnospiraceae bacterium]|nr:hypothetical protein [Lachnospiraceae bacterium]